MPPGGRAVALLIAGLLALPSAIAAPIQGEALLATSGPLAFAGTTGATLEPVAILNNNTAATHLDLTAAGPAHFCVHQMTWPRAGILDVYPGEQPPQCSDRTNLRVQANGGGTAAGWAADLPAPSARVDLSSANMSTEPRASSRLASPEADGTSATDGTLPSQAYFIKTTTAPHLLLTATGSANVTGGGLVKIKGLPLVISSDQGSTTVTTGETFTGTAGMGEVTAVWVTVEYSAGSLLLEASSPIQIAATSAPLLDVDGTLTLGPTTGLFNTTAALYNASGKPATMTGHFRGSITPTTDGSAADLTMSGDLQSTSIVARPIPFNQRYAAEASWLWPFGVVVGLALAGGAVAVAIQRHNKKHPRPAHPPPPAPPTPPAHLLVPVTAPAAPADPEPVVALALVPAPAPGTDDPRELATDYATRAEKAADAGKWPEAEYLLRKSLELDPSIPARHMEMGLALTALGDDVGALREYERAAEGMTNGEPEILAAERALALRDDARAASLLLDALTRPGLAPDVLDEIETEPSFARLRENPAVKAALDAALRRAGRSP